MQTSAMRYVLMAFLLGLGPTANCSDFYAYYTKVDSGLPFEQYSRTSEHADIVVALGELPGKLVFSRGSSYLPYWQTPAGKWFLDELIDRRGDGDGAMPDRVNAFSHVRIIESTEERALILWRYLPVFGDANPHTGLAREKFVEEYFEVLSDGVLRRAIHQSGYSPDDWRTPDCGIVQELTLTARGIEQTSLKHLDSSTDLSAVLGNPVRESSGRVAPLYCWKFDEGVGRTARESQSGAELTIDGRRPFWHKGVSGTSLRFDGYTTRITYPVKPNPALADGLTLEGWVGMGAYPWNWAPIVQQGDDKGFFLGVSSEGKPALRLYVNQTLYELVGEEPLPLQHWTHIAGTYDAESGELKLFINGALVGEQTIPPGKIAISEAPIQIGKGMKRLSTDQLFKWHFKADYALDGLLDEVRVYDEPLPSAAIKTAYEDFKPADNAAELPSRALPEFSVSGAFGARQEQLKYHDAWDNLFTFGPFANVVVDFEDSPAKFVFWHGTSFVPHVVGEKGEWYNNEWNETWNKSGGHGCMEPLCDKESFFSHVRVIESTPARVVVHWRFACIDSDRIVANYDPNSGWGDWADWYFTIYPDGVAAKKMQVFTAGERNHEFQESVFVLGPGVEVGDILNEKDTVTFSDLRNARTFDWANIPEGGVDAAGQKIKVFNFVGAYNPVLIGDFTGGGVENRSRRGFDGFPSWNHWPICQIPSDGRTAKTNERARHSSVSRVFFADFDSQLGDRPYLTKLALEGITNKGIEELNVLGRSWFYAPQPQAINDCSDVRYDKTQRAFVLTATGAKPELVIDVSEDSPLYNPAFVVSDWGRAEVSDVQVDHQSLPARRVRQGVVRDTRGVQQLIVWLEGVWTTRQTLRITLADPLSR